MNELVVALQSRCVRAFCPKTNISLPCPIRFAMPLRRGARYVQTPEMTGARAARAVRVCSSILRIGIGRSRACKAASGLARRVGDLTCISVLPRLKAVRRHGRQSGRCVWSGRGGACPHYDKIHMFDVDLDNGESWRESAVYKPGGIARTVDLDATHGWAWGSAMTSGFRICFEILRSPARIS
jgi:hypothetical protein